MSHFAELDRKTVEVVVVSLRVDRTDGSRKLRHSAKVCQGSLMITLLAFEHCDIPPAYERSKGVDAFLLNRSTTGFYIQFQCRFRITASVERYTKGLDRSSGESVRRLSRQRFKNRLRSVKIAATNEFQTAKIARRSPVLTRKG